MKRLNKNYVFVEYTILFAILCLIVFSPFYNKGLSLVWGDNGSDGLTQHLNTVTYWGQYIRSFFENLIHGKLSLPMWDNSIGYGADIISTLNYYAIGDPINLIYIFSNKYNAEYFYDFAMILRLYLAGFTFVCFGKYLGKNHIGILFGSVAYIFSGYMMLNGIRHPFFINPMIYLPLLIIGVEKIYKKERPYIFTITVAIAAMSNFYFFYMLTAVTVIYAFIRFPRYKEDGFFKTFARFTGWYLLGVGISAIILLPVLIGFMGNARGNTGINYFTQWFYTQNYYKAIILQWVGYKTFSRTTTLNYITLSYCSLIALFLKKDKNRVAYKAAAVISFICLISPVCSYILHGFSYPMSRWIFAVAFMSGAVIMEVYPDLLSLTNVQKIGILAGVIFYYIFYKINAPRVKVTGIAAKVLVFTLIGLIIVNEVKFVSRGKIKHCIMGIIVIISVTASAFSHFSLKVTNFSRKYLKSGIAYKTLCSKEVNVLKAKGKEINHLYRTDDMGLSMVNWGLIDHFPTTTNYLSITDGNVSDTLQGLGLNQYQYRFRFRRLDQRQGLSDLFGVKYLLARTSDAKKISKDYQLLQKGKEISLYENSDVFPFGYTYDTYITKTQYKKLNALQKEEAMLYSAIVEDDNAIISGLKQSERQSDVKIKELGTNYFIHKNKKGTKEIKINIPKDHMKENAYVYIQGVRCEKIGENNKKHQIQKASNSNGFYVSIGGDTKYLTISEKNGTYDIGEREYLVKIPESQKGNIASLLFYQKDDYTIKNISVVWLDKKKQDQAINERRNSEHLENISYDGGNHFSGQIKTSGSKMLCIPIVYNKGWKATDNGKHVKIEKVNGMFLGICLEKGKHKIKLDYTTPGIKVGAVITILSIITLFGVYVKRKKENS